MVDPPYHWIDHLQRIMTAVTTLPIFIALGANLPSKVGQPEETLSRALEDLDREGVKVRAISKFYRTTPVPVSDQPDFINAAARLETSLNPLSLLDFLHDLEEKYGRQRTRRWEARVLDLDLIAYGNEVLPHTWPKGEEGTNTSQLILPHPRLQDRAFVLVPLGDIAGDWQHPVSGENVSEMLDKLPDAGAPQPLDFPVIHP